MDAELFFNQIKLHLPNMGGVAVEIKDDKMNFYVDGRVELFINPSCVIGFEPQKMSENKLSDVFLITPHAKVFFAD